MVQGFAVATGSGKYEQMLERCEKLGAVSTALEHPCEATALTGAVETASCAVAMLAAHARRNSDRR